MRVYRFFVKAASTFFYAGYFPFVPGTFASVIGLALYYLVKGNALIYGLLTLFLLILGFIVAGRAEKLFNKKDARYIVIDEVSGMLLCFLFLPYDIKWVIAGFFLFRLFDALKPYPVNSIQDLKGSPGVMCDDIIAGFYTNIVLQIVFRLASFTGS